MRVQDIVERLTVLGLDAQEASVYVHLSVVGASKAGDVAQALGLQRTETYRTLDGLVQRGFVRATDERPSRFEAAPPEALFRAILSAEAARLESTRRAEAEIAPALRSLQPAATGVQAAKNTFKQLQGRGDAYDTLERMARGAQREFLWVDTHPSAAAVAAARGTLDLLAKRAREGLPVRVLLRAGAESAAALRAAGLTPEAARELPGDGVVRLAIADGAEILAWLASDPAPGLAADRDTALWSDAEDFAATERALVLALWRAREAPELPPAAGPGATPGTGRR